MDARLHAAIRESRKLVAASARLAALAHGRRLKAVDLLDQSCAHADQVLFQMLELDACRKEGIGTRMPGHPLCSLAFENRPCCRRAAASTERSD